MASSSKSKQQWQVKPQTRNWLDLPSDVTGNILNRIGVVDILVDAQKVCTAWRKICKDPAMWRVIHMNNCPCTNPQPLYVRCESWRNMCKHAVDRSQGQLVDITIIGFANDELLQYIADRPRSSQLKCLNIACCYARINSWTALEKFVLLEELSLSLRYFSKEAILTASRCCAMLKTLKVNQVRDGIWGGETNEEYIDDEIAIAIGENLPQLRHLGLVGDNMPNTGLQTILDGCRHLESLDLSLCFYIDLKGDLGKRCSEQIKCLQLPNDSLDSCPFIEYSPVFDKLL